MENEKRTEQKYKHTVGRKLKRILAVTMSLLMIISVIDYSGLIVNAEEPSGTRTITAIEGLPESVSSQQIAVGGSETDINLPDTMNVTLKSNVQDKTQINENNTTVIPDEKAEEITEDITLENVTWNINVTQSASDTFASSVEGGTYIYEPVLPADYTLGEGVSLPQIQVTIKANEDNAASKEIKTIEEATDNASFYTVELQTADPNNAEASVTEASGTLHYYDTLEAAIADAKGMEGSTVTLMKDATTEAKVTINSGTFIINLNNKTWSYQSSGTYWMLEQSSTGEITIENGNVTGGAIVPRGGTLIFNNVNLSNDQNPAIEFNNIDDSKVIFNSGSVSATNSYFAVDIAKIFNKVCSMQINGGTFSGGDNSNIRVAQGAYLEMTGGEVQGTLEVNRSSAKLTGGKYGMVKAVTCGNVDNFLSEGYAYRSTSAGTPWVQNSAVTEVSGVTVQQAPIQIVAQPQGVDVTYGYATEHTLSVTAQKTATATGEISYQWYKVKSGTETNDVAIGTNSNAYTISKGLAIGTDDNYYCAVTCDGYTINTQNVNFKIDKATPIIAVSATVSGEVGSRQAQLTAQVSSVGEGGDPTGTVKLVDCTNGNEVDVAGATAVAMVDGKAIYTWTGLDDQIYKVKVVYSGDGNYNTATSAELVVDTIKKNQSSFAIENIGTKTYGDSDVAIVTTGGCGSGIVTITSSDSNIVSVSGNMATIHKSGTVTLTATKYGDDTYNNASTSITLTIAKKALLVKADDKQNIVAGSAMPQLTYNVTGLANGDTFTGPTILATADTNTVGEHEIRISGGTLTNAENYEVTYINAKLTIVKLGIKGAVISGIFDQNYNGNSIEQSGLSVQVNGKILTKDNDYTLTYNNNTQLGTATVTITGKGIYIGTIEKNFQVNVSNGATYTIGDMVYKITSPEANGNGSVTLVKSTMSKSKLKGTLKIEDAVTIGGQSFKITGIDAKAFKGYTKITKVTIGNNVTTIGKDAFSGCSKVSSITIGTGLKTISNNAFYKCKNLKTIKINSKQLKTVGKNAIKKTNGSTVIKVPSSKVKAYKKLFKSKTGFTEDMQIKKK